MYDARNIFLSYSKQQYLLKEKTDKIKYFKYTVYTGILSHKHYLVAKVLPFVFFVMLIVTGGGLQCFASQQGCFSETLFIMRIHRSNVLIMHVVL